MIIDGKKISADILSDLKSRVARLNFKPILCDLLVGEDAASLSYVKIKGRKAESIGMEFLLKQMPEAATTEELIAALREIQLQPNLRGLIVQLPLPEHIDRTAVLKSIDARVDVDVLSGGSLVPPTAGAILHILETLSINLKEQKFLIVGHGDLVGKPTAKLLQARAFDLTIADIGDDLVGLGQKADVIISGTGQAGLITRGMVKSGAVVIDAGTSESGGSIVGDVDFESVSKVAAYVSPVPGGVGPVTVAKLLENVVMVAEQKVQKDLIQN